jgi:hypothetical protein
MKKKGQAMRKAAGEGKVDELEYRKVRFPQFVPFCFAVLPFEIFRWILVSASNSKAVLSFPDI